MTKISRFSFDRKTRGVLANKLWEQLDSLNKQEVILLLQNLLTSTELVMLSKRLEILKALEENTPYYFIRDSLKVTDVTIAKLSNLRHRASSHLIKLVNRLSEKEKLARRKVVRKGSKKALPFSFLP